MSASLDEDLTAFIRGSLPSVWALELLLLLKQTRDRHWTERDLVLELRASAPLVGEALATLERAGLVSCDDEAGCLYAPASAALDAARERLEEAYKQRPVTVVNVILSTPKGTLQTFADAFRVKGRGEGK